jgi:hypothetical protein
MRILTANASTSFLVLLLTGLKSTKGNMNLIHTGEWPNSAVFYLSVLYSLCGWADSNNLEMRELVL